MTEQEEFEFRLRHEQEKGLAAPEKSGKDRVKQQMAEAMKPALDYTGQDATGGILRGAGSIGTSIMRALPNFLGGDTEQESAARRANLDPSIAQFTGANPESTGYQTSKLATEILGTAGAGGVLAKGLSAIPGAAKYAAPLIDALRTGGFSVGGQTGATGLALRAAGGGATGGASAAMVNPEDAAKGAAISAAIPVGGKLLGETGKLLGKALRPSAETTAIAQKAQQYGIPLGLGDIAENKAVQATRSILKDAPFSGGMAQGAQEAKQEAFNKAVGATFGAPDKKLTLPVLDAAKDRMGTEFDRIWGNNVLQVDPTLIQKMSDLDTIAQKLPASEGASLQKEIQDIYSRMVPDANGNMEIPGDVANKFQQYLRRRAEGSAGLKNELGDLRQALIQSFNRSVSPVDAAALTLNRTQYKAFKTVEPILRSAELGVAGRTAGDVPASLLPGAVNKSYSNLDVPLADLSQVGSKFLVDRTAQTGGSARAALQNTAIGAALAGGAMTTPWALAAVPSAMAIQKLLQSPGAANALMGNGQVSPKLIQALRAAQIAAPVATAQ